MACIITVHGGELPKEELVRYLERATQKFGAEPKAMDLTFIGDEVEIQYQLEPETFQRIRRITGYLVGTVDRFNDAKRNEERERIKHSVQ
jgi:hypothetical protein